MKKFIQKKAVSFLFITIFFFGFWVNYHYAKIGVQVQDTFFHYDSSYFILNGKHPFKDYWNITGILIDYLQAGFFYFFGVNFKAYVYHASLFNSIFGIISFWFFLKLSLGIALSFLYAISITILFYPSSGVPFVDHHAVFFCIISFYFFIIGLSENKNLFLIFSYIFLFLSFLCKQIPFIFFFFLFLVFLVLLKKKKLLLIFFLINFISLFFLFLFFKIYEISNIDFFNQYIFYPFTVGESRSQSFDILKIYRIIGELKFIFFALALLIFSFLTIKKKINKNKNLEYLKFFFILFSLLGLIVYQSLTKNQILIFFVLPIIFSFISIYLKDLKKIKFVNLFLVLILFFYTFKYHYRYNENRYFLDYKIAEIKKIKLVDAVIFDDSLKGLNWNNPYSLVSRPEEELKILKDFKEKIIKDNNEQSIIISSYLGLSAITKKNMPSPMKWYDNVSIPDKKNKYYLYYKNYFKEKIKKNNINTIYISNNFFEDEIINFYGFECIKKKKINKLFNEIKILKCT